VPAHNQVFLADVVYGGAFLSGHSSVFALAFRYSVETHALLGNHFQ
jgi:hypothetical protein